MTKLCIDELKKGGILVSTPMYGLTATDTYIRSLVSLAQLCGMHGIKLTLDTFSFPIVTQCRNILASHFMDSDATHLMFIDADMGFDPKDVLYLKSLMTMTKDNPYDIVGGCAPKKAIDWSMVRDAALKGIGKDNPQDLENYTSNLTKGGFNFVVKDATIVDASKPLKVEQLGTGFLMIKKSAMEKFADKYQDYRYYIGPGKEITQFFHTEMEHDDANKKIYQTEDYFFCNKAREIGLKIWLCPWMKITHTGTYTFKGNMLDIAKLGNNANP